MENVNLVSLDDFHDNQSAGKFYDFPMVGDISDNQSFDGDIHENQLRNNYLFIKELLIMKIWSLIKGAIEMVNEIIKYQWRPEALSDQELLTPSVPPNFCCPVRPEKAVIDGYHVYKNFKQKSKTEVNFIKHMIKIITY